MGEFRSYFNKTNNKSRYPAIRELILQKYKYDINNWKSSMDGRFGGDAADIALYEPDQILMGIEIEKEHTPEIAKRIEIAMDHLDENPKYYTELAKMEGETKKLAGIQKGLKPKLDTIVKGLDKE